MKKINLGIVCIIIVVIILIIHCINYEKIKKQDEENIEILLEEYYLVHSKYLKLGEIQKDINTVVDDESYNNYLSYMKSDLSKYIYDEFLENISEKHKSISDEQRLGKFKVYEFNKEIIDITDVNFYKDYIIVDLNLFIKTDIDGIVNPVFSKETGRFVGTIINRKQEYTRPERIIIKKINDNEYKIVYHLMFGIDIFRFENNDVGE